jgi:hypothetical protein
VAAQDERYTRQFCFDIGRAACSDRAACRALSARPRSSLVSARSHPASRRPTVTSIRVRHAWSGTCSPPHQTMCPGTGWYARTAPSRWAARSSAVCGKSVSPCAATASISSGHGGRKLAGSTESTTPAGASRAMGTADSLRRVLEPGCADEDGVTVPEPAPDGPFPPIRVADRCDHADLEVPDQAWRGASSWGVGDPNPSIGQSHAGTRRHADDGGRLGRGSAGVHHPNGSPGWDPHHENAVHCISASPFTIRVSYRENTWDLGHGRFPIVIGWGDGTSSIMSVGRAHDPYDAFRPYQVDHTYRPDFGVAGRVVTDNAHYLKPGQILFLKRVYATCPPPAQTPEVPFAVVLPLSGLASSAASCGVASGGPLSSSRADIAPFELLRSGSRSDPPQSRGGSSAAIGSYLAPRTARTSRRTILGAAPRRSRRSPASLRSTCRPRRC